MLHHTSELQVCQLYAVVLLEPCSNNVLAFKQSCYKLLLVGYSRPDLRSTFGGFSGSLVRGEGGRGSLIMCPKSCDLFETESLSHVCWRHLQLLHLFTFLSHFAQTVFRILVLHEPRVDRRGVRLSTACERNFSVPTLIKRPGNLPRTRLNPCRAPRPPLSPASLPPPTSDRFNLNERLLPSYHRFSKSFQ